MCTTEFFEILLRFTLYTYHIFLKSYITEHYNLPPLLFISPCLLRFRFTYLSQETLKIKYIFRFCKFFLLSPNEN